MSNIVSLPNAQAEVTVTPFFEYLELENVPQSELAGHAVMEMREVVRVQFAGSNQYSPVFPVDAQAYKEGGRPVTYAERWAKQYAAFKEGDRQEAQGTPLEMLKRFGVTASDVSLCRALKIYSVEALYHLEGQNLKSLGMIQNKMKDAARAFMAEKSNNIESLSEIEALKKQIAELKGAMAIPEKEASPEEIKELAEQSDVEYEGVSEDKLKEMIADKSGSKPRGNPSRSTLIRMLNEAA